MRIARRASLVFAVFLLLLTSCSRALSDESVPRSDPGRSREEDTSSRSSFPEGTELLVIRSGGGDRESLTRAVRLRDMTVAERTGVTLKYADAADDGAALIAARADQLSGEREYCAAEGSFSRLCAPLFAKGALRAAEEFGGALGTASLNPSLKTKYGTFFITGAAVPASLGDVSCIAVNLGTARRFNVRIPDEKTLGGKYGRDALAASSSVVPGGEGIFRYGATDRSVGAAILWSAGFRITEETADGVPAVASVPDGAKEALERAAKTLGDGTVTFIPDASMPGAEREDAVRSAFSDPGILYLLCKTGEIPALLDAGDEIRIIPYPGGESYADSVNGTAAVLLKGGGASEKFLSALEEASLKYTFPEAIDACLSGRTRYDVDSRDALVSILSSPRYELSLAAAGTEGERLNEALTGAASGGADALAGWERKAALASERIEMIFGADP